MKLFHVTAKVDNGMERFFTTWYVASQDILNAVRHVPKRYEGDIVRITSCIEVPLVEGMFIEG